MFIGILVGLVLGLYVGIFVRLPFTDSYKFLESTATGFGIGLAFVVASAFLILVVKFLDKQSHKVKSGEAK